MSEKPPARKVRKNRLKKTKTPKVRGLRQRLVPGLKVAGVLALLLAISALFMVSYVVVTTSDYFSAQTIVVKGNRRLTPAEILNQADMKTGDNILAINLGTLRRRLLAHPWIKSAQVSRQIPHTIKIGVEEEQALAILDMGRRFLINDQGRVFKEFGAGDPQALPTISGMNYGDLSLAHAPLSKSMQAVIQVLTLGRSKRGAVPYADISRLHLDKETGITLTVGEKKRLVKLGFGQFEKKNKLLRQLLTYLKNRPQWRNYGALDVNNPERIVVQPGTAPQEKTKGA